MIFCIFLVQFIILFVFEIKRNRDYLILIHPLIYFLYLFLNFIFIRGINYLLARREENKSMKEIPKLIDFLKSYLLAGLLLPNAMTAVLKQKKWCYPIRYSLTYICNHFDQGNSFKDSLSFGIEFTKAKKSRQYLCFLFLALRLGCSTGENLTQILEKMKDKTQDRLNLERKLKMTTAQMRLQSLVIILAPLFLSFILYLLSPEAILFFFRSPIGNILLVFMVILNIFGAYLIHQILRIK